MDQDQRSPGLDVLSREATEAGAFLRAALPLLRQATGALGIRATAGPDEQVVASAGDPAPPGAGRVDTLRLDGDVTLTVTMPPGDAPPGGALALALVDATLSRLATEALLVDLEARVDNAQALANMGDYDWHIASNTNRWSDQLFRIYGHEPQSFNASYEMFLSLIHPDDRDRVQAIHQQAYATGEPYQMIERVVRPDGEVRHLSSNGQVVMDAAGNPVRFRGTCVDITDQVLAEQAVERSSARFRALVESAPDAIVVVDSEGGIVESNLKAEELLGGPAVGRSIREVLPWPAPRRALGIDGHGLDRRSLQLDLVTASLSVEQQGALTAVFLHDAGPRLQGESVAARLREAQVRRRQALELNDTVVQGLTASVLALQSGDEMACSEYLGHTLSSARTMMNEWLEPLEGTDLEPGDLTRASASSFETAAGGRTETCPSAQPGPSSRPRVLLVEDNVDVRMLLRAKLEIPGSCVIVGEAGDGEEGVRRAQELRPDVVLLDLAMPRMDGLTALPLILEAVPGVRVIVLSGFDQGTMAARAIAAGAHAYLEKGMRMDLEGTIRTVLEGSRTGGH